MDKSGIQWVYKSASVYNSENNLAQSADLLDITRMCFQSKADSPGNGILHISNSFALSSAQLLTINIRTNNSYIPFFLHSLLLYTPPSSKFVGGLLGKKLLRTDFWQISQWSGLKIVPKMLCRVTYTFTNLFVYLSFRLFCQLFGELLFL